MRVLRSWLSAAQHRARPARAGANSCLTERQAKIGYARQAPTIAARSRTSTAWPIANHRGRPGAVADRSAGAESSSPPVKAISRPSARQLPKSTGTGAKISKAPMALSELVAIERLKYRLYPAGRSRGEIKPLTLDQAAFDAPRTWSQGKAEPTWCFS